MHTYSREYELLDFYIIVSILATLVVRVVSYTSSHNTKLARVVLSYELVIHTLCILTLAST